MNKPILVFRRYKPMTMLLACVIVLTCARSSRSAEPAELAVKESNPPKQVAADIQAALQHQVYQLTQGGKLAIELWLRKQITLPDKPNADKSSAEPFGIDSLQPGTLLGVIQVHQERYDFRDEEIPPGVYTLRLAIQPEDGDHLGTAPTKTFALLVPAEADTKLDAFADPQSLQDAAAVVNAAGHPSNLNIQPVEDSAGTFPRLASHHGGEHQVIYLQIPIQLPGGKRTVLTFALVYDGIGEV